MAVIYCIAIHPCAKCGDKARNSKGACVACTKARDAKRYLLNRKRIILHMQSYRLRLIAEGRGAPTKSPNKEQMAKAKERYKANTQVFIDSARVWRQENPEAIRAIRSNRTAKLRKAGGKLSKDIVVKLQKLQRGQCPCCSRPLGESFHLDHKMPLALGGRHSDENMQLLRQVCNLEKGAKHPVDFMQARGFLL